MNNLNKIEEIVGERILKFKTDRGGCIAITQILKTKSGKEYFLKSGFSNNIFKCEANGLIEISKRKIIKTPDVLYADDSCLLLECIKSGIKNANFFKDFGVQLARLHKCQSDKYGFFEDNYIGSSDQINSYNTSWEDFYFNNRLLIQFKLAEKNGYVSSELRDLFKKLESKISIILSESDSKPCLLHGDLWAGNYMIALNGDPVLIDPAVYFGDREADLAMTKLFGGFTSGFYESYEKEYPLSQGYSYRENVYILYHVFNHLNLFGMSYYNQCVSLMRFYL